MDILLQISQLESGKMENLLMHTSMLVTYLTTTWLTHMQKCLGTYKSDRKSANNTKNRLLFHVCFLKTMLVPLPLHLITKPIPAQNILVWSISISFLMSPWALSSAIPFLLLTKLLIFSPNSFLLLLFSMVNTNWLVGESLVLLGFRFLYPFFL